MSGGGGAERISVALCTYNGARHVEAQLASLARQTRIPDELVVRDDRSTDETVELVRRFAHGAPFPVRLVVNEVNLGSTANFAAAIAMCEGELIALCDQDDVWLPEKLAVCEAALRANPRATVSFSDALVVDDRLEGLGYTLWEAGGFAPEERRRVREGEAVEVLARRQVVTGATMLFRATLRDLALPIPAGLVHDGWLALLAAATGELVPVEAPLMLYRQHGANQIGARRQGWLERVRRRRSEGPPAYLSMARDRYLLARERLVARARPAASVDRRLLEVGHHLAARCTSPGARSGRLLALARELAAGRYFRYSNGLYSLAEDLLRS